MCLHLLSQRWNCLSGCFKNTANLRGKLFFKLMHAQFQFSPFISNTDMNKILSTVWNQIFLSENKRIKLEYLIFSIKVIIDFFIIDYPLSINVGYLAQEIGDFNWHKDLWLCSDNKSPCLGGPDIHIISRICSLPTPNKHAPTWILDAKFSTIAYFLSFIYPHPVPVTFTMEDKGH